MDRDRLKFDVLVKYCAKIVTTRHTHDVAFPFYSRYARNSTHWKTI